MRSAPAAAACEALSAGQAVLRAGYERFVLASPVRFYEKEEGKKKLAQAMH